MTGEGLEATTQTRLPMDTIIVIPDADQTPEQLFGLVPGVPAESQVARRLAENGYNVIVPALIDRTVAARNGRAKLTSREFIYRSAFELGRHLIGYEVQKVLALVDLASRRRNRDANTKIGVFGYGEGGAIALYAAALDPRIERRLRERLFRRPQRRLATARRSQRLRPPGAVRRRRGRQPDRAADVDRRGGQRPRVRHPAGHRRRTGPADHAQARTVKAEVDRARTLIRRAENRRPDRAGDKRPGRNRTVRLGRGASTTFGSDDAGRETAAARATGPIRSA